MEAENSENAAKLLMNAFSTSSTSPGLGLLGSYSSSQRYDDLERQISELTDETL
jgi:hypothetical protein